MATQSLSPEMTSYARLCLAINDVCTKSFRDVLLCSVPNKDIKQAIKAHWGPHYNSPMLKKYPYSNFFPNHQLDPNFSVSNCDMSLLYSLIRNVSSVQQPSLGWGQSCWNNPQDTSIGANVERLHELRNTVIHLQEPRLSNQEFNSYWNKLRGCVTVIDTYLGGTTYQEKLECLKIDDMDPECANRLIGTFRSSLQDLQAGQLEQDKTLYNIGEKLNQGFQDNKIADDRMIEELSEVKDLIKEDNRQLSQTVEHVKELKDRFEVIHKLMEGKAKENDKIQPQLNSDHGVRTENTTSNQDEHESEITLGKHDSRDSEKTKDWNENRVEKTDVDKSSRSESLAVQVQLKTKDVLVKADHDNNGGIEIGDLASGLDGKLCITKQYAFIKSNLTRESGLVIAKCLLKQKLLSQDAYDRMGNTCCARRHPIDILLKKVIHGGKEEIVEAFFKRLKVECPLIARAVKDTTITEMDRLRFAQLEARGVEAGGLFRTIWCVTSGPDVRFFKYHLSESEEVVEHITDVMLSRLHFSIQDHSSIIDCPTSDDRISVLFQKMQLYKLDVVKELSDVVKPELHQKWMEFRSTQDPWWSGLFQWMKQSKPVIDGSFEFENIELKEVETGSIILKFIAGVNFSVDLLKPESLKNKIKTLLKRGCLESKTETKSVAHITVYIESPPNKDRKEIHIYIDFHATDVSIEAEDHQDEMRIRNRDIMLEEMNPARLKQWMLDQPCIQKSHRDMLESKLSEKGLFRQEEMTVLLDFISGLENGYHLLEKYCEKNDLYVYNKVFRKHQESHSQQEISGHRAAVTYVKGGGLQKLFSFSIILNDEGIDPDMEEDKDQPPEDDMGKLKESFLKEQEFIRRKRELENLNECIRRKRALLGMQDVELEKLKELIRKSQALFRMHEGIDPDTEEDKDHAPEDKLEKLKESFQKEQELIRKKQALLQMHEDEMGKFKESFQKEQDEMGKFKALFRMDEDEMEKLKELILKKQALFRMDEDEMEKLKELILKKQALFRMHEGLLLKRKGIRKSDEMEKLKESFQKIQESFQKKQEKAQLLEDEMEKLKLKELIEMKEALFRMHEDEMEKLKDQRLSFGGRVGAAIGGAVGAVWGAISGLFRRGGM